MTATVFDSTIRARTALTLVYVLAVLAGCGGAEARTERHTVRDSAGIHIVENHGARWGPGEEWRISVDPEVTIGAVEGPDEYQLFRVSGALRLADGRFVVANAGTHQLRFYDPAGRHLRSVGRQGEGPGEFRALGWVRSFAGDSLAVHDFQAMRLSIFDVAGELGRTFTLSIPGLEGFPTVLGTVGQRVLLTSRAGSGSSTMTESLNQDSLLVLLYGPEDLHPDTVTRTVATGMIFASPGEGMMIGISVPFGASPQFLTMDDGFYFGFNDTYDIGLYGPDGTLQRRIRRVVPSRPLTPADIAEYKERRLEGVSSPDRRSVMEKLLADVPYPSHFPVFQGLLLDTERNLWVRDYPIAQNDPQDWAVFDPDGRMLGMVRIPERSVLRQVGSDFVLISERDELEVEYLRMYRLIKP